jgi:hypothetical protein
MSFNLANAWKRGGLLLALLATFCVMQPSAAATQGMMGRHPAMGEETIAVGVDGTLYVLVAPVQRGMGREFGRVVLLALDLATLRVRWRYALEDENEVLLVSRPVVSRDGTVYFTVSEMMEFCSSLDETRVLPNARLLAVRDGTLKWSYEFDAPFASHPVLSPESMLFVTTGAMGIERMPGPWDLRSQFVALEDRGTSAAVRARLDLGAYAVSAPIVGPHPTSAWAIYVAGERMGMRMEHEMLLFIITPDFRTRTVRLR